MCTSPSKPPRGLRSWTLDSKQVTVQRSTTVVCASGISSCTTRAMPHAPSHPSEEAAVVDAASEWAHIADAEGERRSTFASITNTTPCHGPRAREAPMHGVSDIVVSPTKALVIGLLTRDNRTPGVRACINHRASAASTALSFDVSVEACCSVHAVE
eukprot:scaffold36261_cov32-Tisochrysis_lutea.AAC.1